MAGTNNGYRPRHIFGGLLSIVLCGGLGAYALLGSPTGRMANHRPVVVLIGVAGVLLGLYIIIRSLQSLRR